MQANRNRNALGAALVAGLLAALPQAAPAQEQFPSKTMTVVMPIAATTAYYQMMRQMADSIQAKTGKTIVFDVALGANGMLSPQRVARAEPDGHTMGLAWAAPLTINPFLVKDAQYDPLKDFAYISMLTRHGIFYVAQMNLAASNIQELVALAKAKPGTVKMAYAATGSHIGIIQLAEAAGVKFLEVPYKSSGQFDAALLSGEVDVTATTVGTTLGHIKAGKMKPIFIGSKNRSPLLPNVQSVSEVYPNVEIVSWYTLFVPAKTPGDRIEWLHREWTGALKDPKIADRMQNSFGYDIIASRPQDVLEQIKREIPVNSRIIREYKLSAE